jgi:hypothetical protein
MSSARRHRVDWSFGPGHGPVSGVLNAAGAMCGLTMCLWLMGASAWWGMLAGGGMAAAGAGVALWYDQRGRVVAFRAASWLLAAFWSVWVLCGFTGVPLNLLFWRGRIMKFWSSPASPWTWAPLVLLVVGAGVVAGIGWAMDRAEKKEIADRDRLEAERSARLEAAKAAERLAREPQNPQEEIGFRWEPFVREITRKDIDIINIQIWKPYYGFTLDCQLPNDGTVLSDIKMYEEALAASAPENDGDGLPDGCGVEIMPNPGLGRRNFIIKVTIVSALGQDIPYPMELLEQYDTVRNPIALGVETDRKIAKIPMLDETTTLIGNTDSGKSNELNVINTGLGRCSDVLLVAIDLSGNGRMPRPWNRAYAERACDKPFFAQIAHNEHRARLLCASLLNIIDARTRDYAQMMAAANSDVLPISPQVPEIVLVIDEFKRLPADVKEMVVDIVETGRGPRVRVVACALEAVAAAIPKEIVKHSRNRIAMRVVDETELQYLFDSTWKRGRFDPASMPWKGSGLYANGPAFPSKFKGYRIEPDDVYKISIKLSQYRPELDGRSLSAGDTVTVRVRIDDVPTDVTYTGVWTNAEAETYPEIFSAMGWEGAGTVGATATGGSNTAAINKGDTMTTPHSNPAQHLADGFAELAKTQNDLGNVMDELQAAADSGDGGLAAERAAAADKGDGDQGGEDGPRSAGGNAGPRTPTAAELAALFDAPSADPVRPRDAQPESPAGDQLPAGLVPAGEGKSQGGPGPKKRLLQLVYLAGDAGTGPTALHQTLAAEGYPTSITTVQNTLRDWKAREYIKQAEERGPYVRGPKFPTERM